MPGNPADLAADSPLSPSRPALGLARLVPLGPLALGAPAMSRDAWVTSASDGLRGRPCSLGVDVGSREKAAAAARPVSKGGHRRLNRAPGVGPGPPRPSPSSAHTARACVPGPSKAQACVEYTSCANRRARKTMPEYAHTVFQRGLLVAFTSPRARKAAM